MTFQKRLFLFFGHQVANSLPSVGQKNRLTSPNACQLCFCEQKSRADLTPLSDRADFMAVTGALPAFDNHARMRFEQRDNFSRRRSLPVREDSQPGLTDHLPGKSCPVRHFARRMSPGSAGLAR